MDYWYMYLIGGFMLIVLLPAAVMVRKALGRIRQLPAQRLAGEEVILLTPGANFIAIQSEGIGAVSGNGGLALTRERLWGFRAVPLREFSIPLSDLVAVETPRSFMGKSYGRKMLVFEFRTPRGRHDKIGFYVKEFPDWIEALERNVPGIILPD